MANRFRPRELSLVGAGKHRQILYSNAKRECRPWTGSVPRSVSKPTLCLKNATTPERRWKKRAASWKKPVEITKRRNVKNPIATIEFFFSRENCKRANKSRPRFALSKLRWPDKSKPQTNALQNWKTNWLENRRRWLRTKASKRYCRLRRMMSRGAKTGQWSN